MNNVFSQRLINARKIRCISQRNLSKKLDGKISTYTIARYEKGLKMPSSKELILLSNALNMSLDYFFRPFVVEIDFNNFYFVTED